MRLNRLFLSLALSFCVVGTLYLYIFGPRYKPSDSAFRPGLVVIQLNDIYRIDSVGGGRKGGLARIATIIKQLQQENQNVLILHAGDFLQPSLESKHFQGLQMIDALNYLNSLAPLIVVPGNHEFDDKKAEMLVNAINKSDFTWLASNLTLSFDKSKLEDPSATAEYDKAKAKIEEDKKQEILSIGEMKIGIFALTLDNAHSNGEDREYAPIDGAYESIAENRITDLEQKGADIIIGLTHLDMGIDVGIARLRRAHPRFMWIAGGHEHYWQHEKLSNSSALVTKGDSNARSVWKVSIGFRGRQPILSEERIVVDEMIAPDAVYQRDIEDHYHAELKKKFPQLDRVITHVKQITKSEDCLTATEEAVRNEGSNWGSFIADQMRSAYPSIKAEMAFINGGTIRIDDTMCDEIRLEHLERTFGFDTRVVYVGMSGRDIKEKILNNVVSSKFGDGSFLQVSGIRYSFDRQNKALGDVKVEKDGRWVELEENKSYKVAVTEFLLDCGDGYKFRETIKNLLPLGPDLRFLVYDALSRASSSTAPALTQLDSRILELPRYLLKTADKNYKTGWIEAVGDYRDCTKKIRDLPGMQ